MLIRKVAGASILLTLLLLALSCKHLAKQQGNVIKSICCVSVSPLIDSLLTAYSHEVPSSFGYAVFLDKKDDAGTYMITIANFTTKVDGPEQHGAISYFMFHDSVPVLLYTGLEDFTTVNHPVLRSQKPDFTKSWAYVHLQDTSYIVKGAYLPFLEGRLEPTIEYHAP